MGGIFGALLLAQLCLQPGAVEDALAVVHGKGGARRPKGALALSKDIERRVVEAGGNTQGVMVASLSWQSADDLDLHVLLPGGQEISYKQKKLGSIELDVDMCVQGRHSSKCTDRPVENIVFDDEPAEGRYKIFVQNFNYHLNTLPENMQVARMQEGVKTSKEERELRLSQNRPVLFDLLLKVHGEKKLFQGLCTPTGKTLASSDVLVMEFDYDPSQERITPIFEATAAPECTTYAEKLLLAGPEARALPRPDARPAAVPKAAGATRPKRSASSKSGKGSKGADAKHAALQAIRGSTREALATKPVSALRALLVDLGTSCKGCTEKSDFVERLLDAAGVRSEL